MSFQTEPKGRRPASRRTQIRLEKAHVAGRGTANTVGQPGEAPGTCRKVVVFGSVARDEATDASDIDVLVEFEEDRRVGLFAFVRLQRFLADILGRPVDLATREAIREEMRDQILKEAVRAA